jgi:hypothetical protein
MRYRSAKMLDPMTAVQRSHWRPAAAGSDARPQVTATAFRSSKI